MTTATLRRSGGSLIMTIPTAFAEQNHLAAGDRVDVNIEGSRLTVEPAKRRTRKRYNIAELLANTPEEFLRCPEWEDMPAVGREIW